MKNSRNKMCDLLAREGGGLLSWYLHFVDDLKGVIIFVAWTTPKYVENTRSEHNKKGLASNASKYTYTGILQDFMQMRSNPYGVGRPGVWGGFFFKKKIKAWETMTYG